MKRLITLLLFAVISVTAVAKEKSILPSIKDQTIATTISALTEKYPDCKERIETGVNQVATIWIESDGNAKAFEKFCTTHFAPKKEDVEALTLELSAKYDIIYGGVAVISKSLRRDLVADFGEITPLDRVFGAYDYSYQTVEKGFFDSKIAFVVALNYPRYNEEQMCELGKSWDKYEWDNAYMGLKFQGRNGVASKEKESQKSVAVKMSKTMKIEKTDPVYDKECKVRLTLIEDGNGEKPFTKDVPLLFHWKLRDEIKMLYGQRDDKAFAQQNIIYEAMKHMIEQTIPRQVINTAADDDYSWNPYTNVLKKDGKVIENDPTNNGRYAYIRNQFIRSYKNEPDGTKYLNSRFGSSYNLRYTQVDSMYVKLLSSQETKDIVEVIKERLGRDLRPYDLWYTGFDPRILFDAHELDSKIKAKYPDPISFEKDIPNLLVRLGYTPEEAKYFGEKITVEITRTQGHASPASQIGDKSTLRTNYDPDGMDFGSFQTAMHELGHTVQQTISTYRVDNFMRRGLPNPAISESAAYIFQYRAWNALMDFENQEEIDNLKALDKFWGTVEMSGMALCELRTWEWMYQQKEFTTDELRDQMIAIAKDIWNTYHAPLFGLQDEPMLAVYNHQLTSSFYLTGYALANLVHIQIENHIEGKELPAEVQRIYGYGKAMPDVWMQNAVGGTLSMDAVLEFGRTALDNIEKLKK